MRLACSQTLGGSHTFYFCHLQRTLSLLFVSTVLHIPRWARDGIEKKNEMSAALPSAFSQLARHKASLCATLSVKNTKSRSFGQRWWQFLLPDSNRSHRVFFFLLLSFKGRVKRRGNEIGLFCKMNARPLLLCKVCRAMDKWSDQNKRARERERRSKKELEWTRRAKHVRQQKQRVNEWA